MSTTLAPPGASRYAAAPVNKKLLASDLRPGDVLLSCGASDLSQLIRRIDGGQYSHAALWDGAHALDATEHGVVRNDLEKDEQAQLYIDAYRWHAMPNQGAVLGDAGYPAAPVLAVADEIVEQKTTFAYDELVMSALVIALSREPADKWLRASARVILSRVEIWLHEHIFSKPGRNTMVCSETVARSFGEAQQPPDYSIDVIVDGSRDLSAMASLAAPSLNLLAASPKAGPGSSYDSLKRRYGELLAKAGTVDSQQLAIFALTQSQTSLLALNVTTAGASDLPFACVTPHDLERSPSLEYLGRLSEKPNLPGARPTWLLFLRLAASLVAARFKHPLGARQQ